MIKILTLLSLFQISSFLVRSDNYCDFGIHEEVSNDDTVNEGDSGYFYFDIEGYDKKKVSEQGKSDNFTIEYSFGTLTKVASTGNKEYSADAISIHIPPEHRIGNAGDIEVMIHHIGAGEGNINLCFLFSVDDSTVTTSSRMFFKDIIDLKSGSKEIDPVDIYGGLYQIKKFYYKDHSEIIENDCSGDKWVVAEDIQKISSSDLEDLLSKLIVNDTNGFDVQLSKYTLYSGEQNDNSLYLLLSLIYLII